MNKIQISEFTVDWKYSAEDVIWNVQNIVKDFPVKFVEEREEYGDWYDVVEYDGEEFKFKIDSEHSYEGLETIMNFVNEHLPEKGKRFVLSPDDGDSYTYRLESF
jgi:hypothetical protein